MSDSDARRILHIVSDLADLEDTTGLAMAALGEIGRLIPGELCNYSVIDIASLDLSEMIVSDVVTPDAAGLIQPHLHEHPAVAAGITAGALRAMRISDGSSLREWKRTNLYRVAFEPFGFVHQMAGLIGPRSGRFRSYAIMRGERDFTDRERDVLAFMAKELDRVHRRDEQRSGLLVIAASAREAARIGGRGVAAVDATGGVHPLNDHAAELLADPVLRDDAWLRRVATTGPPPVVTLVQARATTGPVRIQIVPSAETRLRCLLVFHDDGRCLAVARRYRLTPREHEVLSLVAEGLTAGTVGRRLALSSRTVEKYLEHIYDKLGVTDRTAAVRQAHVLGILDLPS